ncbi:hypothetical protein E3T39_01920 [Cryobacterium suzukii]|uniref:Uncharacterized protein n=1 Tax=Cryobacterium suzukii TaxID=1259198 RepID=A0A4R9AIZ1_9MICO|nr:hypothetical protein [Cryobacterium suzukii]TFD62719.1 hypothetical protein E3T39_01920 [Cryobacterium suzukii]
MATLAATRGRIQQIALALGEMRDVPGVQANRELIDAVSGDAWWDGVTLSLLELRRLRLRVLVRLLDSSHQAIVYTDFEDTLGEFEAIEPRIVTPGVDRDRFHEKLLAFLREHQDQVVLHKLRMGR